MIRRTNGPLGMNNWLSHTFRGIVCVMLYEIHTSSRVNYANVDIRVSETLEMEAVANKSVA